MFSNFCDFDYYFFNQIKKSPFCVYCHSLEKRQVLEQANTLAVKKDTFDYEFYFE